MRPRLLALRAGLAGAALTALAALACGTLLPSASPSPSATPPVVAASATAAPTYTPSPQTSLEPTVTAGPSDAAPASGVEGVRACAYVPGSATSLAAPLTAVAAPTPAPLPTAPTPTAVDAETTARQLRIYRQLWETVNTEYVYEGFNGQDWAALGRKYEALIEAGLADADFYSAMNNLLTELDDEHSYFESPDEVAEADASFAGRNDYVGIGILAQPIPEAGRGVILLTFPGGPAAEAGLSTHDSILRVNGEPLLDETGALRDVIRGPAGTSVTLTVQRPGESPFDLTLARRRITGALPIDDCLVPTTRIGYVFLPSLDDETIPDQMRSVLTAFTAAGPLEGLVLDNRQNRGGASTVLEAVLGFFTNGTLGHFVSRTASRPLEIEAEDVGGSQSVPLVVLVDVSTASYGEVLSGVLQASGRALLVGRTTPGNMETTWGYSFEDGSRAWIAHETFQPLEQDNGVWETTGIVPDVEVPTRWDLFTEATDPALAAAVELLSKP